MDIVLRLLAQLPYLQLLGRDCEEGLFLGETEVCTVYPVATANNSNTNSM